MHTDRLAKAPLEEVIKELGVDPEQGLSTPEALKRLKDYGYNEIPEKRTPLIIKFLSYFWGPIPWMIEGAAALSAFIGDWTDFWIIIVLLLVNGVVGFWQEYKAANVVECLKKRMALRVKVKRDYSWRVVPARELVPGDIVRVRMGDIVPADVRIISDEEVEVDESALTGESLPVKKGKGDVLYSGSIVKRGEATAVVVSTGVNTFFGKTVKLVEEAKTQSELQKTIIKLGNFLILLATLIIITIVVVEVVFGHQHPLAVLKFALVLAVAAIPAALPAVLSITMALGAMELAKRQAIVTRLVAVEELAGVDVLCTDKTGTLTKNKLTVGEIYPIGSWKVEDVLLFAALASREENQDPIDLAVIDKAKELGLSEELKRWIQKRFIPFDPAKKRTEAFVTDGQKELHIVKGAPQVVASLCIDTEEVKNEALEIVHKLAEKGFRAIAVAVDEGNGLKLVGILPLFDPPRDNAKAAIDTVKALGVNVKMVTGDHVAIAKYIARLLGIGERAITASELEALPEEKRDVVVESADIFAEVLPEHKYAIVDSLQRRGHLVAMTGDGVNDAPALRKAHCGIAVAGATDAARAAAAIVLLTPGISVIVDALKTARRVFQRMESYVIYRFTETIRVLGFLATSILVFRFYPISATMVILLAILNDLPILMIAYDNVREPKRPTRWHPNRVAALSAVLGGTGVISSFIALWLGKIVFGLSEALLRTFIFLKLIVAGHSTLFVTRSRGWLWEKPWPSGKLFAAIIGTDIIGTLLAVYGIFMEPIGWGYALFIWAYALAWMFVNDAVKQVVGRRLHEDVA